MLKSEKVRSMICPAGTSKVHMHSTFDGKGAGYSGDVISYVSAGSKSVSLPPQPE